VDIDEIQQKSTAVDVFTVVAILLIIGIPIYGYFKLKPDRIFDEEEEIQEKTESPKEQEVISDNVEEIEDEPVVITGYTDELVEIDGQWAYIAVPEPIDSSNLPTLVIYNHGSITRVEEELDPDFKKDLLEYTKAFIPHNYIFAVSNARGFDLDSEEAIMDNYNMYNYIKEKYGIQEKIYMIAYSKGGVAALNFTSAYPDLVTKIAMVAGRMRLYEWDEERSKKLKGVEIKSWHGTDDINVSFGNTVEFIEQMEEWGIKIDLIPLEGKTHWNVKTEYVDDISEFFNQSETVSE
jgi:predicted esterase